MAKGRPKLTLAQVQRRKAKKERERQRALEVRDEERLDCVLRLRVSRHTLERLKTKAEELKRTAGFIARQAIGQAVGVKREKRHGKSGDRTVGAEVERL